MSQMNIVNNVEEKFEEFVSGTVGAENPTTPDEAIQTSTELDTEVYKSVEETPVIVENPEKTPEGALGVDPSLVTPEGAIEEATSEILKATEELLNEVGVIVDTDEATNSSDKFRDTAEAGLPEEGVITGSAPDSSEIEKKVESFYTPDEDKVENEVAPVVEVEIKDGEAEVVKGEKDPEEIVNFEEVEAEGKAEEVAEEFVEENAGKGEDSGSTIETCEECKEAGTESDGNSDYQDGTAEDKGSVYVGDGEVADISEEKKEIYKELEELDNVEVIAEVEDHNVAAEYVKEADIVGVTTTLDQCITGNESLGSKKNGTTAGMESLINNVFDGWAGIESATSVEDSFDRSGSILDDILKGL